jgi:hypothetical protein
MAVTLVGQEYATASGTNTIDCDTADGVAGDITIFSLNLWAGNEDYVATPTGGVILYEDIQPNSWGTMYIVVMQHTQAGVCSCNMAGELSGTYLLMAGTTFNSSDGTFDILGLTAWEANSSVSSLTLDALTASATKPLNVAIVGHSDVSPYTITNTTGDYTALTSRFTTREMVRHFWNEEATEVAANLFTYAATVDRATGIAIALEEATYVAPSTRNRFRVS